MCPAALAAMSTATMFAVSLGLSAVTAGVGYVSQQQTAAAQLDAQQKNINNNAKAANTAMIQSVEDLQARELQERAATALRVDNAKTRTMQAKGTALASSDSAGLSLNALMSDYDRQYQTYADAQYTQLGYTTEQLGRQREGFYSQAESRINSVPLTPVTGGSIGGSLLSVGSSALSSYRDFAVRDPLSGSLTLT